MAQPPEKLHLASMRSPLGRARGLGASHSGAATWRAERIGSVALVPLTIWFVVSVLTLLGSPRAAVVRWAGQPLNSALLLALVAITFQHMALGLQVVIEDYIHSEAIKIASLLAMKAITLIMALAAAVAVLKMAFAT
jgi:succinate dehydrogenase / fumarate reductase membrane anchor subunit